MAPRPTTSDTAPSNPSCTAWCSRTRPASSRTPRPAPDRSCRASSRTSSTRSSSAASSPTASRGYAAGSVGTTSCWRSAASVVRSVRHAVLQVCAVWSRAVCSAPPSSRHQGHGGAVTLIQRFGSAVNLNIHPHCLVLDDVYRCDADGVSCKRSMDCRTSSTPRSTGINSWRIMTPRAEPQALLRAFETPMLAESGASVRSFHCLPYRRSPRALFRQSNPLSVARPSFRNSEYRHRRSGTAGH